jgi:ankyrin repeat protein
VNKALAPEIDVSTPDRQGNTPLHLAATSHAHSAKDAIAALVVGGANVHARNKSGYTPLHQAARHAPQHVAALLRAGADPNARTTRGVAPIHLAIENDDSATGAALLDAGA